MLHGGLLATRAAATYEVAFEAGPVVEAPLTMVAIRVRA